MDKPAITQLSMVILMQHDLDAAIAFYRTLGLTCKYFVKDTWAEFELGAIKIGLCKHGSQPQENRTGIVFEVNDLDAYYHEHKEAISFVTKPIEAAHGIMTSIQDPGGNILDIYQPTPEKLKQSLGQDDCCKPEQESCCGQEKSACC